MIRVSDDLVQLDKEVFAEEEVFREGRPKDKDSLR